MSRRSASFIDLHAEKLALGLCVLVLAAAGVYSFGGMRFKVAGRGPADLLEEAGRQADATAQTVRRAQPRTAKPSEDNTENDPVSHLGKWFARGKEEGLVKIAAIEPQPRRTQKFPPLRPEITGVAPEDRRNLARIVAPSVPIVVSHVGLTVEGGKMRHATKMGAGSVRDDDLRWYIRHLSTYTHWPVAGINVLEPIEQGPRLSCLGGSQTYGDALCGDSGD